MATRRRQVEGYESYNEICGVPECDLMIDTRSLCGGHYRRWVIYGDPRGGKKRFRRTKPDICAVYHCERPVRTNGVCSVCYNRQRLLHADKNRYFSKELCELCNIPLLYWGTTLYCEQCAREYAPENNNRHPVHPNYNDN